MNLREIVDLAEMAVAHAEAGDCAELEITFTLVSEPEDLYTGTYEPEPPPPPEVP